jgi:hypothetical protein
VAGRRASAPRPPSAESTRVTVPKLNKDPIWSLKPWPVTVEMHGLTLEIPALPAVDWLVVLMQPELSLDDFIDELLPGAEDMLYEQDLDLEQLYEACLEVISAASGRSWWVAMRLIGVARDSWHILSGEMLKVDATRMSLSGWLDVLVLTIVGNMDPKDTAMFSMRLEAPPPDVETKPEELEMSASAFLNMGRDV